MLDSSRLRALPLLLALAALAAPAGAQQTPDALALLEAAADRYRQSTALCADFRQVLEIPLLNRRMEGAGRLCQRRPNLFSMRFSDPEGDLVVIDGSHAWLYHPSRDAKQVIQAPIQAGAGGGQLDFHREFLENPSAKYEVTYEGREEVGGAAAHRILLVPIAEQRYREARIWLGAATPLIRRVEIREENGSIRTIELSKVDLSPAIPEGTFTFTPPPGTRVIKP